MRIERMRWVLIAMLVAIAGGTIWFMVARNVPNKTGRAALTPAVSGSRMEAATGKESFEFPFLGKVIAAAKVERIRCGAESEGGRTIDVKVFHNDEGTFLRAEYLRPGTKSREFSAANAEKNYAPAKERIVGVPTAPARVPLQTVIDNVRQFHDGKLEKASQFSITRVVLAGPTLKEPQEVFIVNTYGIAKISDRLPDDEAFFKVRFVLDAEGKVLFMDNIL